MLWGKNMCRNNPFGRNSSSERLLFAFRDCLPGIHLVWVTEIRIGRKVITLWTLASDSTGEIVFRLIDTNGNIAALHGCSKA